MSDAKVSASERAERFMDDRLDVAMARVPHRPRPPSYSHEAAACIELLIEERDAAVKRAGEADQRDNRWIRERNAARHATADAVQERDAAIADTAECRRQRDEAIAVANRRTGELLEAEERARVLADGVRLFWGDNGYDAGACIKWKDEHGHLVKGEAQPQTM